MKVFTLVLGALGLSLLGCGEASHDLGSSDQGSSAVDTISAEAMTVFQAGLHALVVNNCGGCHGVSQAPMFAVSNPSTSADTLLRQGLVNLSSPATSRIVVKVNAGHQGFGSALGMQMTTAITDWATAIAASPGGGGGLPAPEPLMPTFKSISERILQPKCVACHGALKADDGVRYDTYALTRSTGGVNVGVPVESKLYQEVLSGSMPRGAGSTALTDEEVGVILTWIQNGALNN